MKLHATPTASRSPRSPRGLFLLLLLALLSSGVAWADLAEARQALAEEKFYDALRAALPEVTAQPVQAYRLRGEAYLGLNEHKQALGQFQRALSFAPQDLDLLTEIAEIHAEQGRRDDAILYYLRAHDLEPANEQVTRRLLELLVAADDTARQVEVARRTLEATRSPELQTWLEKRLGYLLHERGEYEEAFPYLEKAAARDEASPETLLLLADIHQRRGEYEEVLQIVDRAMEIAPRAPELILLRGDTLRELQRFDQAYREYWKLKEMKSALWDRLSSKIRIAAAQEHGRLTEVVSQQYGIVTPLLAVAGILVFILLLVMIAFARSRQ